MEHRAWKAVRFAYPASIPTMLAAEEKQYLYWLGREGWTGTGIVLEIGPWLGGSTACLAAGMRASGHDARGKLHAVDNFLWREFMASRAPLTLRPGDSFEPFFRRNIAEYGDIVVPHARALPDEVVAGDHEATAKRFTEARAVPAFDAVPGGATVEILFIDGAKSWRGMAHLLRVVRERVVPGRTLFVCQDYKYWGMYWVPMMMARLRDYVEPVHNVLAGTTVTFRLAHEIPVAFLDGLEDHVAEVPTDAGLALIDQSHALLAGDGDTLGVRNVSLSRVSFLAHQGKKDAAVAAFEDIQAGWPALLDPAQLEIARAYLRTEKGRTVARPLHLTLAKRVLGLRRRVKARVGI